ncbi:MAG: hypothetical protein ACRD2I_17765 [Vicinamibacterales bacterium]
MIDLRLTADDVGEGTLSPIAKIVRLTATSDLITVENYVGGSVRLQNVKAVRP